MHIQTPRPAQTPKSQPAITQIRCQIQPWEFYKGITATELQSEQYAYITMNCNVEPMSYQEAIEDPHCSTQWITTMDNEYASLIKNNVKWI